MTFFSKFLPKIIISSFIILFLILAPFFVFSKLNLLNYSLNKEYKFDFQGVLTLWNIDTFEGGSVSRTAFLEKRAIEFEKQNKGVYISVENMSLEQLKMNLESNKKPNIITFGIGVGELFCDDVINIPSCFEVRIDLISSSKIDNNIKALPIMLGGYSVMSNKQKITGDDIFEGLKNCENNKLIFSSTDAINPLLSLFVNDITLSNQEIENVDSFEAYDKFINNKFNALLGTQRDFYRCKNRESNMKMQCGYNILGGFSDLIQYASVFKSEEKTQDVCIKFLEYLVNEKTQEKLAGINMFPVINKNIYSEESYKNFNNILLKPLKTLNVFLNENSLKKIKNLVTEYVFESKIENKVEILKYLS